MTLRRLIFLFAATVLQAVAKQAVAQPGDAECGVRCVFVALHSLDADFELSLSDLRTELAPSAAGNSMNELQNVATACGFQSLGVQTNVEGLKLRNGTAACIAHLKHGHYVIVLDHQAESIVVADPPKTSTVPIITFLSQWSGNVLLISKNEIEREESIQNRLWWRRFKTRCGYALGGALGIAMVVFAVRRLRRYRGLLKMLLVLVGASCIGCTPEPAEQLEAFSKVTEHGPTEKRIAVFLQKDQSEKPILQVEPKLVNLGDLLVGDRNAKAEFAVTNNFATAIDILQIQTSCGCTIASTEKSRLEPGESTRMVAAVNLTELGKQASRVRITGSVPEAVAEVYIQWNAGSSIGIEPRGLYCGVIQCGSPQNSTLLITPPNDYSLDECIEMISCSPEGTLSVRTEQSNKQWVVHVTISPIATDDHARGHVKIHGRDGMPDFRVPVEWKSVNAVSLSPSGTFVGNVSPNAEWAARFVVTSLDHAITEVRLQESPSIEFSAQEISSRRTQVKLLGHAPASRGPFNVKITVEIQRETDIILRTLTITGIVQESAAP